LTTPAVLLVVTGKDFGLQLSFHTADTGGVFGPNALDDNYTLLTVCCHCI